MCNNYPPKAWYFKDFTFINSLHRDFLFSLYTATGIQFPEDALVSSFIPLFAFALLGENSGSGRHQSARLASMVAT